MSLHQPQSTSFHPPFAERPAPAGAFEPLLLLAVVLGAAVLLASAASAGISTPRVEVVSETPGAILPGGATADPPQVSHLPDGSISITTAGFRNCPVLPARAEASPSGAVVILAPVPGAPTCGSGLQLHTTVIRLDGHFWPAEIQVQPNGDGTAP